MTPEAPAEWDDLIDTWDEIRQGYYLGDAPEVVLDCAKNLEASVRADSADTALWTLGLVLTGPCVIYARPDAAAEARALEAMGTVEQALGGATCTHDEHPCDGMPLDDELDNLRDVLEMLVRPDRDAAREIWACPRNLAGFARAFTDAWPA
ncbi:hypothetical protein ACFY5C_24270 [Streptomyces sp. NPDC012935]|uniref:hypothetical protein n=1 Tax=Streptomyces sp. NPDC012935 TaxID=3364857 RepID=UPI0036ADEE9A